MAGIEIVGPLDPNKIFGIRLWPFLNFFILQTFLHVNSKNGALGNLGEVRLVVLSLTAGITTFGPQKIFRYTFMTLLKLFDFMNFSACPFKKGSPGKLRLAGLTLTAGIRIFWPQKNFWYTFMTLLKFFYVTNFSLCQ